MTEIGRLMGGAMAAGEVGCGLCFGLSLDGRGFSARVMLKCESHNNGVTHEDILFDDRRLFIRVHECADEAVYTVEAGDGVVTADRIGVRCGGVMLRRLEFYDRGGWYLTLSMYGACEYDAAKRCIKIHRGRSALIVSCGAPDECAACTLDAVKLLGYGDMRESAVFRALEKRKSLRFDEFIRRCGVEIGGDVTNTAAMRRVYETVRVFDALGAKCAAEPLTAAAAVYLYSECGMADSARDLLLRVLISEFPPVRNPGALREGAVIAALGRYAECGSDIEFVRSVKRYADELMARQSEAAVGGVLPYCGNEAIFRHGVYDVRLADEISPLSGAVYEMSRGVYEKLYGEYTHKPARQGVRRSVWGCCEACGERAWLVLNGSIWLCPRCCAEGREAVGRHSKRDTEAPCHPCAAVLCEAVGNGGIDIVGGHGFSMAMTDALVLRFGAENLRNTAFDRLMREEWGCFRYGDPTGVYDAVSEAVCAASAVNRLKKKRM